MKGILTHINYELDQDDKPTLNLFVRNERGKREHIKIDGFQPHFCFRNKIGLVSILKRTGKGFKLEKTEKMSLFDDSLLELTYVNPKDTEELRDLFYENFEADIRFVWRYLIDKDIYSGVEFDENGLAPCRVNLVPLIVYFDIEVLQSKISIEGDDQIACISTIDNYTGKIKTWKSYGYIESEEKMLLAFQMYLKRLDPDILAGFNISKYDLPVLINRCRKLGVKQIMDWNYYNGKSFCKTREIFDLDKGYRKLGLGKLSSLSYVAEKELGKTKREVGNNASKLWYENPNLLFEMNREHVSLTKEIDEACGIIEFFWDLKAFAGLRLSDVEYNSRIADMLLLRKAKELRIVLPTKKRIEPFDYEGAYVFILKGIYDDVFVFDFETMYPSIIKQFNVSPEKKIIIDGKVSFDRTKIGLVPSIFDELLEKRKKLKERMEKAEGKEKDRLYGKQEKLKFITNSVYGVFGYSKKHSDKPSYMAPRLADKDCAEFITRIGRELIKFLKAEFDTLDMKPILGDTDSIFLLNVPDVKKTLKLINDELIPTFLSSKGIKTEPQLKVAFKRKFPCLLIKTKKNYAGLDEEGKLIIKGLGYVKSDTSELASNVQWDLLFDILKRNDETLGNLKKKINDVETSPLDWFKIARATKLTKEPDGYKANAPHVRAVKWSNEHLGTSFQKGDKILWAWAVHSETDVIAFDYGTEVSDDYQPNREKLIDEIRLKTEPLLEMVGLSFPYQQKETVSSDQGLTNFVAEPEISEEQTLLGDFE